MDNDAFFDNEEAEITRLLMEAAEKARNGQQSGSLKDHNGNTVGFFEIDE